MKLTEFVSVLSALTIGTLVITEIILIREIKKFRIKLIDISEKMFGKIQKVEQEVRTPWWKKTIRKIRQRIR